MALMKLEIVTPDRKFFSGDVKGVLLKGPDGLFEILPRHTAYVATLVPSDIKILAQDGDKKAFLSSGFVEVTKDKTTIVADTAEWPEEIDIERAKSAQERAEERLRDRSNIDVERARLALSRALARQKASSQIR
jgi:F-type H+-transporting ATPase subunit epsilon